MAGIEKKLEKRCTDVAKANGWWSRKFSSPSNRGVPDRIYIKEGMVWFIEFKAPGNVPTRLQAHEMKLIADHGANVFCIDDVDDFKKLLRIMT
jgi:hypothetical protein